MVNNRLYLSKMKLLENKKKNYHKNYQKFYSSPFTADNIRHGPYTKTNVGVEDLPDITVEEIQRAFVTNDK